MRRPLAYGVAASMGLALFYVAVVAGASRSLDHLVSQAGQDWYYLLPIVAGFGVQVGIMAELRRRHRLMRREAAAGATGAGASTVGMVACCAHHIADLVPLLGATAAATFLLQWRVAFMVAGISVNAVAITIAARRLRRTPLVATPQEEHACAPA